MGDRATSIALMTAVLMVLVPHLAYGTGVVRRSLSASWLVHLGVVSYGFYLWHYPVVYILRGLGLTGWALVPVALGATLAACEVSWRWVEQPVLRYKDRWARRHSQALAVSAS